MSRNNRQKKDSFKDMGLTQADPDAADSSAICMGFSRYKAVSWNLWAQILLIFLAVIAVYSHTLHYPFYFDDFTSIVDNKAIRDLKNFTGLWRYAPLRIIGYYTFALNYHFNGLDVFGYHIINIFIHALTGCAVLIFCRKLTATPALSERLSYNTTRWFPLLTALLFVLHPLQTQAVTYIVQRLTSLAALFYISALACYVQGRISMTVSDSPSRKKIPPRAGMFFLFTCIFSLLALFSKQNTATLPLAFILVEIFFFRVSLKKLLTGTCILILSSTAAYFAAVLIFHYQPFSLEAMESLSRETTAISRIEYLATQTRVLWGYIGLFLLPVGLHIDHDVRISQSFLEAQVITAIACHLILLVLAGRYARRQPLVAFSIFFFYITNLVESSVIPITDVFFEHRAYLPSVGLCIIAASTLVSVKEKSRSKMPGILIVLLLCTLGFATYNRNAVWHDPVTLWQDCIDKAPDKARPNNNLGKALFESGATTQSLNYLSKAITISPDYAKAHNNIGILYLTLNNMDAALKHFETAVAIEPVYENAHNNLGYAYHEKGDLRQAETHYRAALLLNRDSINAHTNLARLLAAAGNTSEAILHLEESIRIVPDYAIGHNNLGELYALQGNLEKAITHYSNAIRIEPRYAKAFFNLGLIFERTGDTDLALKHFEKALEIDPGYKEAETRLWLLKQKLKEPRKEISRSTNSP